jgi:predicted Zn-dependent peptidase
MINRTIEDAGGVPFTSVDRRGAKLGYTVTPDKAVGLLPLLATDCAFEKWDVRDAKKLAATEKEAASGSASIVLTESLYAAAYGPQSPAGRTLYSANLPTDSIKSFRARTYGLNGAVLAATGVQDHAAFCREAEALLSSAPTGDSEKPAAITYLGGETRLDAPFSGYAHVTMGFEAPVSSVVASVVEQYLNLAGMPAGVSGFSTAGLVGVYAGSDSPGSLVDAMIGVVASSVDPALVKRAKTLAKAEALLALDDGSKSLANAMTAAVLESNIFTGPADVAASFDKVTDAQVTEALAAMRKSNPSVAAVGDIAAVPYHATVAAALK